MAFIFMLLGLKEESRLGKTVYHMFSFLSFGLLSFQWMAIAGTIYANLPFYLLFWMFTLVNFTFFIAWGTASIKESLYKRKYPGEYEDET